MQESKTPKISVIIPSLNMGRFLRDTLDSIFKQSYKNFEILVADGGSTDETVEILKEYAARNPNMKWASEKDGSILEGYRRAFGMSTGEYIMQMCSSDGYIDKDWFYKCVEILDNDPETSLVFGTPRHISEEGVPGKIFFENSFKNSAPQKKDFFGFWLYTGFHIPEGNLCCRRDVFDECFPKLDACDEEKRIPWFGFDFNFNTSGFLPYFLPVIANYYRIHKDQRGQAALGRENIINFYYRKKVNDHKNKLFAGHIKHYFKDGSSRVLSEARAGDIKKQKMRALIYRARQFFVKDFFKVFYRFMNYRLGVLIHIFSGQPR